jgi:tRNA 5-methylaminomethyl-2-thiouridine biosynthesis bifunctional protein
MNWQGRDRFTVLDADYGDGSRCAALIAAWRADPLRSRQLHVIALAPAMLPGFHRVPQQDAAVTLDLLAAPLATVLAQLSASPDAIRLHHIGADVDFVRPLARIAPLGARLDGAGLSDAQVAALRDVGFVFEAGTQQAVFASRKPRLVTTPVADKRAIVIGAGLAGSAACERLCARGWDVTLVERHAAPAMEASGNLAGIFMPLLSRDDNIPTRLTRAAYLYALRYWDTLGGIGKAIEGAACGVLQLARDPAHAQVSRAIARETGYPPHFAEWLERDAAQALLGHPAPDGGWLFRQGGWARPGSVCAAMLDACGPRLTRIFNSGSVHVARHGDMWQAIDADGAVLASATTVIVANGPAARQLSQAATLPLSSVRGQVTHIAAHDAPALPLVLCREAYITPPAHGVCSFGATYDLDADPGLRMASQQANLANIRDLLQDERIGIDAPLRGRVGFRCVAPDRLPLVGHLPHVDAAGGRERLRDVPRHPGLYALLGYASRGLIWAPLAAELLAAQLDAEPLPLETNLVDALDPARFVLRARRTSRIQQKPTDGRDF